VAEVIYLDHHATTPIDPRVLAEMMPWLTSNFGNPASGHAFGKEAAEVMELARADVASLVQAEPDEVTFVANATEANNLALQGVAQALAGKGNHIITSAIEHSSIVKVCEALAKKGWQITTLPVGRAGVVDPADVRRAITPRTVLVTVMSANNEIGTVQPVQEIGAICRERGVVYHSDACQGFGRTDMQICPIGVPCVPAADMISLSGHKLYAPKGIGALIVRRGQQITPQVLGGSQEHGLRAGTPNVAGIVALGRACAIMRDEWPAEAARLGALRDYMLGAIVARLGDTVIVNGAQGGPEVRLPHNINITLKDVCPVKFDATAAQYIAVSGSSACTSNAPSTSRVIEAIGGLGVDLGATVRVGLGRFTTPEEVAYATEVICQAAERLRGTGCEK
jgi:cysteine desulfurase